MDKLSIVGGVPLEGRLYIGGAKNAALPLLAASLLTTSPVILSNVPELADIQSMADLLVELGCVLTRSKSVAHATHHDTYTLHAGDAIATTAPYDCVRKMRASILVLGPLLAHYGHAEISLPGGCAIGTRPIDLHLKAMEALGATIVLENGYVKASAPHGLSGGEYVFPIISVTGTMNLMMAASLARGKTVIYNAAREPEVEDLGQLLTKMGARLAGLGTDTITVEGVSRLGAATHSVMSDRIEAGTYIMAAAITGGDMEIIHADLSVLPATVTVLEQAGVRLETIAQGVRVRGPKRLKAVDVITAPFPGYATDLQAQIMALMCVAEGSSVITETIFENRFMHVAELNRLGAEIQVHGSTAMVKGVPRLKGAEVMATDLRASVALVLAGLVAEGETVIHRIYHLDRGYEHIEAKLRPCGAKIQRI